MKQVERYFYPAVFTYEPGQEIAVDFPDLKCATSGVNDDDALLDVTEEFLMEAIQYYREKYGSFATIDNYVIYFEPALGVLEIV